MENIDYPKFFEEESGGHMVGRKIQPEIKDLVENLNRFLAVNHDKRVVAVGMLAVFDKDENLDREKNVIFASGDIEGLRIIINDMRDRIEDNVDDCGMVDI